MDGLVFVALGDSLTVGFSSSGNATPYTYHLEQKMAETLSLAGKPFGVKVYNRGVNGDLTGSMLRRFQRDVVYLKPDYVVILGGSNDIGWGIPVEEVYDNLMRMYVKASENRIQPIACTVPSVLGFDEIIPPMRRLNRMIERYCTENSMTLIDLFKATADPETYRLLERYSDDGLHLTREGYVRIAEEVFKALEKIIETLK